MTAWIGAESDDSSHAFVFTGHKADYYSLLVSGFTHGHLYLNAEADPGLASPDLNVREHTPTLLDADYYKGHFYLYYGVVPAALLLLPYRLLTGQDLGINIACLAFWFIGFGASLYWLRSWWREHGPEGGALLATLVVTILAFFPATTFLVRRSMFYELPLVAGYACISIFFAAFFEVMRRHKPMGMLALASLSLGLAVGCHPNHIALLPLLAWAALIAARDEAAEGKGRAAVATAALLPVAAIGASLAWYNFARFGDIFEFGFKYGQNGFFAVKHSLFAPRFLWANFRWYFLTPPALTPYFPFVFPGNNTFRPLGYEGAEAMHGQLVTTILSALILIGAFATGRCRDISSRLGRLSVALGYAVLVAFLFVGILQIRANRYMADFDTPLAWLIAAWGCWTWINLRPGLLSALWKTGFSGLVLVGSLFYILAAIQQFEQFRNTRPGSYSALSRALNIPYQRLYEAGMSPPGLLVMNVHFAPQADEAIEPLVTTGTPGYSDSVYVAQEPNHLVQFRFNHKGYGGPTSPFIPVDLNREHVIEISMGSFYPPIGDSYFGRLPGHSAHLLKSLAYLRLDGKVIISATMNYYEAPPWSLQIGANGTTFAEFRRTFSGEIRGVHMIPVESLIDLLDLNARSGVLDFKVQFPAQPPLSGLPLVGCGVQGDGNLVLAKALGGSSYRIEMDDWGFGALMGKTFTATPGEHTLQIVIGPMLARSDLPASYQGIGDTSLLADRIVVRVDGETLGSFKLAHHLDRVAMLTPGANPQGFSTAVPNFGGAFESIPMTDAEVRDLLAEGVRDSTP